MNIAGTIAGLATSLDDAGKSIEEFDDAIAEALDNPFIADVHPRVKEMRARTSEARACILSASRLLSAFQRGTDATDAHAEAS